MSLHPDVIILGAGIIGVTLALELRLRGEQVLLIDPAQPCEAASRVNAGVVSSSSVLPMAGPGLWRALPRYLSNRDAGLRLHPGDLPAMTPWLRRFLARANRASVEDTARALQGLTAAAPTAHLRLADLSGATGRFRQTGWTKLYRQPLGKAQETETRLMAELSIPVTRLDAAGLRDLEPGLAPVYQGALHYHDAWSVDSPRDVGLSYFRHYRERGGAFLQSPVRGLRREASGWSVITGTGRLNAARLVVAAGAGSAALLRPLGLDLPMVAERGYSAHLSPGEVQISRPMYDTAKAFVMTPMREGIRISTGVELALPGRAPDPQQMAPALREARLALNLPAPKGADPEWRMGMRPSLPDGLPAIGRALTLPDLWVATGHAHIGFSTSAITAQMLAADMAGTAPPVPLARFAPDRF